MKTSTTIGIVLVIIVIIAVLLYLIPYLEFKPLTIVSLNYTLSGISLSGTSYTANLQFENPNPYNVEIVSISAVMSYDDGISISANPAYLPVEIPAHGTNVTVLTAFVSYGDYLHLIMNPPTSYTVTITMTINTPISTKTITCSGTTYIKMHQSQYTCTES